MASTLKDMVAGLLSICRYPHLRRATSRSLLACLTLGVLALTSANAQAVTGCSLNDPERDLRGFFPQMDAFETQYLTFGTQAPRQLKRLGERLGAPLDSIYETLDVPYTLYTVWRGQQRIGHAFGANQRGKYSNIQVIAITDGAFKLRQIYLQKIQSF